MANWYKKCGYLSQHNGSKFFAVGTASSLVSSHHSLDISSAFWFYKTFIYFVGLKASWVQEEVKFIPSEALRLKLKHSLKLDLELQMVKFHLMHISQYWIISWQENESKEAMYERKL
ncbi:hypothetical protein P8452_60322 [Trifolium repens]|nr:hypothetical protein P8452_60322 [Trifolium repens]